MKVKIYQVSVEKDSKRVAFLGSELLDKFFGEFSPDKAVYDMVFDGEIPVRTDSLPDISVFQTLESLYSELNKNSRPEGYYGRSLSVSDVVEYGGKLYFCDSVGFREIFWAESLLDK